ncbi:hypothetical protein D3C85_1866370 [compost metagenome]
MSFSLLLWVEDIVQGEGGDFLAAQTRLQRQAHHHPVMGVLHGGQERLDLGHAQVLGQDLGFTRQHIVRHGLAAAGIEMR